MQPDGHKRLPSANEFSPSQIDLRRVLELAKADAGDRAAIVEAIRAEYYSASAARRKTAAERLEQQQKRANNVLIGMKEYGLFDLSTNQLTGLGEELLAATDDATRYARFARHILAECHGIEVIDAVQALHSRHERPTKEALHRELETRGFRLSTATTDHTSLLNWLGPAGVVKGTRREIDDVALGELTGVTLKTLEDWAGLNREQRAVLRTLRRLGDVHGTELMSAQDLITQSKYEHGNIFREDQLAARVFRPLVEAGWLTREVGSGGRGGKSGRIGATEKLLAVELDFIPTDDGWGIPPELRPKLNTSLADIEQNLKSTDKNIKGIALELLALRIATDASLTPLRFRLRAAQTSGAEVDLVAEGTHLHFSRWLFQCKNTRRVDIADAAKEVGMAVLLRVHVIVLVTTGRFSETVQTYARDIMDLQPLQIVMIDGGVLAKYRTGGVGALMDFLHHEATETMRLKRRHIVSEFEHGIADDQG